MYTTKRILAIIGIFAGAVLAWLALAGVTSERTSKRGEKLGPEVQELWGHPQVQGGPTFTFHWFTTRQVEEVVKEGNKERRVSKTEHVPNEREVLASATTLRADLRLDQRLKGLLWYSLYDVTFDGAWTYVHDKEIPGKIEIGFSFPVPDAVYDDFRFMVDDRDMARETRPSKGSFTYVREVQPGQTLTLQIQYKSRGLDSWTYRPSGSVASLQDFTLTTSTNFTDIDFSTGSMSPSRRQRSGDGWILTWNFRQVLTGRDMGVVMPARIQPGELATRLAAAAPVSLLFYFLLMFVLSVRHQLDIHPLNYLGIAAAFFSFHLLFSYSVDHLSIVPAFVLASATSIFLVVSYLRLVVSARFAYRRAAVGQLVYQVGFSVAHFWAGYTGLTISILSTLTLFLIMQMTGRIRWSQTLAPAAPVPPRVPVVT